MNASFVLWHSMNTTYSPSYWLIFLLWWVFMWQILMYTHSTYNEEEKDWNLRSEKRHRKQIKRKTLPKMKRKKEMMNLKYETLIKYSKICFVLTLDRTCANGSAIVMHYRQRIFWNLVSICDWEISSSFLLYFIFFLFFYWGNQISMKIVAKCLNNNHFRSFSLMNRFVKRQLYSWEFPSHLAQSNFWIFRRNSCSHKKFSISGFRCVYFLSISALHLFLWLC